jgi:hypothetical protein
VRWGFWHFTLSSQQVQRLSEAYSWANVISIFSSFEMWIFVLSSLFSTELIFQNFSTLLYVFFTWDCWHEIFCSKIFDSIFFPWCIICRSIAREYCSPEYILQVQWEHLRSTCINGIYFGVIKFTMLIPASQFWVAKVQSVNRPTYTELIFTYAKEND